MVRKLLVSVATLLALPLVGAASCDVPGKKPDVAKVIDRHTPGDLQKQGRKGSCWQLVISHTAQDLEYRCTTEADWRAHPVGVKYP